MEEIAKVEAYNARRPWYPGKDVDLNMAKTFKQYLVDKEFSAGDCHITKEEYCAMPWMNVVPEIVCDILCYLCNYFHYRTDAFTRDAYVSLLTGQTLGVPVASQDQIDKYEEEGWMYSSRGIQERWQTFVKQDPRAMRIAPPTEEEILRAQVSSYKKI